MAPLPSSCCSAALFLYNSAAPYTDSQSQYGFLTHIRTSRPFKIFTSLVMSSLCFHFTKVIFVLNLELLSFLAEDLSVESLTVRLYP